MTITKVLHILIVDDNSICSALLARIFTSQDLKQFGPFSITILCSAEKALDHLEKSCCDIIFTDIEMRGMSGDEMTRIICNGEIIHNGVEYNILEKNCNIPIIAITAKYDPGSLKRYKEAGIAQCLAKPVEKRSIHTIIEKITS